jgi:hypothetical protein
LNPGASPAAGETVVEDPPQAKILNATKISGRTQKGLGIGILNAITRKEYALYENKATGASRKEETMPLTNYNILVLDQTLKHNSSISLVNTNVWRSGTAYDANVTSALFDLNNKKNKWNIGGNISFSNIIDKNSTVTGYAHSIYMGKTSGQFTFNIWQDLFNGKYDKSDMGYFTNNNTMDQGAWFGYNWNKPKGFYNRISTNINGYYSRLVSPLDNLRRRSKMFQNAGINYNLNIQTKKLQWFGLNLNGGPSYNDFYESRTPGRLFHNKGRIGANIWYESNSARKLSWSGSLFVGEGGIFHRTGVEPSLWGKIRFSKKFSIDNNIDVNYAHDQAGYATTSGSAIIFSRRDVTSVEDVLNMKYNFTNKMGLSLRARHYWSKVRPTQFYELDTYGELQPSTYNNNLNQNYNYLSVDAIFNWEFAQGSFFSIAWKDIGGTFEYQGDFENKYLKNLGNTVSGPQFNSLSIKVIYFLDYLTFRNKMKRK